MELANYNNIRATQANFPDAAKKKNKGYYQKAVDAILHRYMSGYLSIGYSSADGCGMRLSSNKSIAQLKKYFLSRQSITHIAEQIDPEDEEKNRLMGIDWSISDYTTPIYNRCMFEIQAVNYKPRTEAIDAYSARKKQEKINKIKLSNMPKIKEIKASIGIQDDNDVSVDEYDMDALDAGVNIDLEIQIDMKNALEKSEDVVKFHGVLKPMFLRDQVTLNTAVSVVELHPEYQLPVVKYIDPEFSFFSPSIYTDHRDATIGGYIENMPISTIRTYLSNDKTGDYPDVEKALQEICKTYVGLSGNKYLSNWSEFNGSFGDYHQQHGCMPYDSFIIPVATVYFIASDIKTFASYSDESGAYNFEQVANPSKTKLEKGEQKQTVIQSTYRVRVPVGTNHVFDYGIDSAQIRSGAKGNKKAVMPMCIFHDPSPSMVERIAVKYDEVQKCEFIERNLLNEMPPSPSYRIDIKGIEKVINIGGKNMSVLQIIDFFKRKGILVYASTDEWTEQNAATNHPPIDFMKNEGIQQLLEVGMRKERIIAEMKAMVGLNDIADGTQSSAELLNGVTQLMNQSVQKAMINSLVMWKAFYAENTEKVGKKYEVMLAAGHEFQGVFFSDGVKKEYKLTQDRLSDNPEFAYLITVTPSLEEKQSMLQDVTDAVAKQEIDGSVVITLRRLIIQDDLRAAELLLIKSREKSKREEHKRQLEIQTAQGKANSDAAIAQIGEAKKSQIETLTLEYDLKTKLIIAEEEQKRITQREALTSQMQIAGIKADADHQGKVIDAALAPKTTKASS